MRYRTLRIVQSDCEKIANQIRDMLREFDQVELEFQNLPAPKAFRNLLLNLQQELPIGSWFLSQKDSVIAGVLFNLNFSRPRRAVIEIANGCNLKCDFCWTHSPLVTTPPDSTWLKQVLDPEYVYKYLDDLQTFGTVRLVEFCAIGDPLYHPQIWDFLAYAKTKGLEVRLSTNGTLLYPKKWDESGHGSVSELFMNISAGDRDTYANIHNVSPKIFDQLIRNLRHIDRRRRDSGEPIRMSWINIITDKNIGNINSIIDVGLEAGADYFDFRSVWIHKDFQKNIGVTRDVFSQHRDSLQMIGERIKKDNLASNFMQFLQSFQMAEV